MLNINPDHVVLKPAFATIQCEPNWEWKKREQPFANYDLFYIWSGEGTVVLNRRPYNVQKGSCFLFKPGDETTATQNSQNALTLTYIHFDVTEFIQTVPQSYRIIQNTLNFESLLTRYVRLLLEKPFGAEVEAKLIIKELMIHLLREDLQEEKQLVDVSNRLLETIREIANYIRQHPSREHSIENLAARANLSPRYFSKKFKQIIGQTVRSYIIQARIERAEHLLYYTGMTVTEAAKTLGYSDLHFFSRQFKQYTGKNPSEIR
ncbi:AraC-like DNA-binding protein [Oikeobacillus pervagus]|uniref:AraC-like DNA-binding protein n=1 Tax=Oikeobacillus pervagus TaxID=1325931 RepID=A0AAJ1WK23_9BACI|nr:AraC family transcriptional regulator [Oikeobacillus pervagus]MDQ0216118.1 AraC-like DNA-binding protein [Oikeobacillus pervagus]